MTYRPHPDSLAAQVIGFFNLNEAEELTVDDIVTKFVFGGDSRNVHTQLTPALDHDLLTWCPQEQVYRRGTVEVPSAIEPPATPADPPMPPKKLDARTPAASLEDWRQKLNAPGKSRYVDVEAIELEKDVPLPGKHSNRNTWQTLLARFEVGNSLMLPIALRTRLLAASKDAKKSGRGTFTIRMLPDGENFRIWRIA